MNFCDYNKIEDTRAKDANTARLRFLEYKRKVEDEKNILRLLEIDYVESIRAFTTKYDLLDGMIRKAWDDSANDGERSEELKQLDYMISKDFVGSDIEIEEIVNVGYEGYAWEFIFEYDGLKFELYVPIHKNITVGNYTCTNEGKYMIGTKSDSCVTFFEHSYNEDDIKKAINEKRYMKPV